MNIHLKIGPLEFTKAGVVSILDLIWFRRLRSGDRVHWEMKK